MKLRLFLETTLRFARPGDFQGGEDPEERMSRTGPLEVKGQTKEDNDAV
jgi:hypothetical protein